MVTTQGPAVRADTVTNRKAKSLDLIKVGGLVADTSTSTPVGPDYIVLKCVTVVSTCRERMDPLDSVSL